MVSTKAILSFFSCLVLAGCCGRSTKTLKEEGQQSNAGLSLFKAFYDQPETSTVFSTDMLISSLKRGETDSIWPQDIPVPLKSTCALDYTEEKCLALRVSMSRDEIIAFYKREMEREGWDEQVIFDGTQMLIIYKKPSRWTAIAIKTYPTSTWRSSGDYLVTILI